jgi:hypothetical protein
LRVSGPSAGEPSGAGLARPMINSPVSACPLTPPHALRDDPWPECRHWRTPLKAFVTFGLLASAAALAAIPTAASADGLLTAEAGSSLGTGVGTVTDTISVGGSRHPDLRARKRVSGRARGGDLQPDVQ